MPTFSMQPGPWTEVLLYLWRLLWLGRGEVIQSFASSLRWDKHHHNRLRRSKLASKIIDHVKMTLSCLHFQTWAVVRRMGASLWWRTFSLILLTPLEWSRSRLRTLTLSYTLEISAMPGDSALWWAALIQINVAAATNFGVIDGIHCLQFHTVGHLLEPDWANCHQSSIHGLHRRSRKRCT